ncbi:AsmA-like C-terminal region-containing protein [Acetobacter orientalis]|uniref:AsmA-like C-terminal region-containing protein n=1 Tax=Acetobacter orientalis TaxID=146474 RepID=UPI0039E92D08
MTSTGQDLPRPLHKRVMRVCALSLVIIIVLPVLAVAALLVRMLFGPVNITPAIRPFLPLTVLEGAPGQPPAAKLTLGRAELRWNSLTQGWRAPFLVSLDTVQLLKTNNDAPDFIRSAQATLDPLALVHGTVGLRTLDVRGVRLALRRKPDGTVGLAAQDSAPTQAKHGTSSPSVGPLLDIEQLSLHDAIITMDDQLTGTHWTASPVEGTLHIAPEHGKYGITGAGNLTITGQKTGAQLKLAATGTRQPDHTVKWLITLAPTQPASFAKVAPALASIKNTVGLSATATFAAAPKSAWLLPNTLDVAVEVGAGALEVAHSPYLLKHASTQVHLALNQHSTTHTPAILTIQALTLDLLDPTQPNTPEKGITVQGQGVLNASDLFSPQSLSGQVGVAIPQVDFANIAQFWPQTAAKGGRRWVSENITTGLAHNLHVGLTVHSATGWKGLNVTGATGGVDASGLTVHWLRPISPLHELEAHLEIQGLDTLKINFDHGYQLIDLADKNVGARGIGRVEAGPGSMTIAGLTKKDQTGTIATQLHGNLRDILALLTENRLHLLSRHPLSFTKPTGIAVVDFTLTLPLDSDVTTDQMTVDAHAHVTHAHLGNVVMNRAITDGAFNLSATTEKMDLAGHAAVGGFPADLSYFMDFRSLKPTDVAEKAHVMATITPASAIAAGIAVGNHFDGKAKLGVDYTRLANKQATVNLALNLTPAQVLIPLWHKAAGRPAQVSAELALLDGHITGVNKLQASGPNLDVRGQAAIRPNAAPELLVSSFRIDRSTGHARLVLPYATQDKTIRVGVYADTLDLSPLMETDPAAPPKKESGYHVPEAASGTLHGPPGNAWDIELQANALLYNQNKPPLRTVKAHFEHNGLRLERMAFSMRGPTPVAMHLTPNGTKRSLHVVVPDMGEFLSAFNILPNVKGGEATLTGSFNDSLPAAPFKGELKVTPFVLTKAPETVLLARNLSLYGWLNGRKSPEFEVTHLSLPVSFSDDVLRIHDGSTGNDALGATLEGDIDLDHGKLDLDGTVVPIFAFNKLPGKLPGVGRLFSPEKNGGFLAMTFGLSGKLDKPDFHVNPYSVLLPGVLRKIF